MTTAEWLAAYTQAEMDILTAGVSYAVPGFTLTRPQLPHVRAERRRLEQAVAEETYGGASVRGGFGSNRG